jgi:peptide-methionine (S)-S-oxide reductase
MSIFDRLTKTQPVAPENALPGRPERPFTLAGTHTVLGTPIEGVVPDGFEEAVFGTGCFWGTEEIFWQVPGVWTTAVGYAGGHTPHPSYEEVCTGRTGHTEVVRVVFDPSVVSYEQLLKVFWETHDPTQGMRQGNDIGTQYRSAVYVTTAEQADIAAVSRDVYATTLTDAGEGEITTEIIALGTFYYAEDYHQQYAHKRGISCHVAPLGVPYPADPGE